jgi:anti-sigma B factor antagonist
MADLESTRRGDIVIIVLRGSLDITSLDDLKSEVIAIEEARVRKVVVDLRGLRQIDSSGVGVIVSLFKRIGKAGGQVRVTGLTGQPQAVFKVLGFDKAFDVCDTVEDALKRLVAAE